MEQWDANSVKEPEREPDGSPPSLPIELASYLADILKMQAEAFAKQAEAIVALCEHMETLTTQTAIMMDILMPAAEEELEDGEQPMYLNQRNN